MSCDVGKAVEGLENELWCRWSDVRVGEWGGRRCRAHSPTLPSLYLRHSSFSNPSAALHTSQLILQPFRCFTYAIGTSTTSQLILQHFRRFTYVTGHSTALPLLHLRHEALQLRHSSFTNTSAASPTSQVILQPFRCFTYVIGTSRTSPSEPPMHRAMKNSVWWISLLQQVIKFRSSYSFG